MSSRLARVRGLRGFVNQQETDISCSRKGRPVVVAQAWQMHPSGAGKELGDLLAFLFSPFCIWPPRP